ncbi:MAG: HIT family protein [Patescibacteria group bacterium]|jgi:histidine triad (HIT) family protein|nr:HIT family protein [Patescibacteria group bacterium]
MPDYKSKTEKGDCILCEIAKGNISPMGNGAIYEDEKYMAWLSPFPNTLGFTSIMPKKHFSSDVLGMPDNELAEFVLVAKKVAKILENYFEDVGRVGLIMEGTGIDHAHIKLFPMHGTGYIKKGEWRQHHSEVETYFEEYKGYISSNDSKQADLGELEKLAIKIRKNHENN